ncbi:hypothetical protein Vi05172_g10801 [Venturia inaequalis]|nr:hypothetical protein Vi05172_g10801 [Venturia inaequalis]
MQSAKKLPLTNFIFTKGFVVIRLETSLPRDISTLEVKFNIDCKDGFGFNAPVELKEQIELFRRVRVFGEVRFRVSFFDNGKFDGTFSRSDSRRTTLRLKNALSTSDPLQRASRLELKMKPVHDNLLVRFANFLLSHHGLKSVALELGPWVHSEPRSGSRYEPSETLERDRLELMKFLQMVRPLKDVYVSDFARLALTFAPANDGSGERALMKRREESQKFMEALSRRMMSVWVPGEHLDKTPALDGDELNDCDV